MSLNAKIVRLSSREKPDLLSPAILNHFEFLGLKTKLCEAPFDPKWPYTAASIEDRLTLFYDAFTDPKAQIVWNARGGYGLSDLLTFIDWKRLRGDNKWKAFLGFSDSLALMSAFYSLLKWPSVHAPMPASTLWSFEEEGVRKTFDILLGKASDVAISCQKIDASLKNTKTITGTLFGGCLSVLTNLIGTKFFPKNLAGHILFFEDIEENPGRVMRYINQWHQAGALKGVKAIVLGAFANLSSLNDKSENDRLYHLLGAELQKRFAPIPFFFSLDFGHQKRNLPIILGAKAQLKETQLIYKVPPLFKKLQQGGKDLDHGKSGRKKSRK